MARRPHAMSTLSLVGWRIDIHWNDKSETLTMRIGVACVMQESNTLAPRPSTVDDFSIEAGNAIVAASRGTNTEVAGFLEELERLNLESVPLFSAWAIAGGPIEDSEFDCLANLLLERLDQAQLDGLLLALHGAWLSVSHSSADAELTRRVRARVGPGVPIVVTLDLHANVRPSFLAELDGVLGYRTYPHIDMAETGRKATRLLHRILVEGLHPRSYWLPIPLLAPAQSATTDQPPVLDVIEELNHQFPASDYLAVSFFCVQPWLDIDEVASSLVVVTSATDPSVSSKIQTIAQTLWNRRSQFEVEWVAPADLVGKVVEDASHPVIVSEAYDGMTGGAPGDHPGLLAFLLPQRDNLSACLYIVDPEAVKQAYETGLGMQFRGTLGAKIDPRFGRPVPVQGRIGYLSDGTFTLKGPVFTGKRVSMGPTAVLEAGRLKIVVGSRAVIAVDPELYRSQGIEPAEQDLVALKSPSLFRPGYASMLHTVLHLDMPGVCRGNLRKVPFSKINRPIWPLDEFEWEASDEMVFDSRGAS